MGIDAIFDAHNWSLVPFHFWSLCFFALGLHCRQLSERLHLPDAAGIERRLAAVALPALQIRDPVLPEHSARDVAYAARPLQKLRRAHLVALLHCGTAHGRGVPWLAGWHSAIRITRCRHSRSRWCMPSFWPGLICATFIDFEHFIIPDEITLGGMVARFRRVVHAAVAARCKFIAARPAGAARSASLSARASFTRFCGWVNCFLAAKSSSCRRDTIIYFTDTAVCLPDQKIPYEEIFYRKSDTIVL